VGEREELQRPAYMHEQGWRENVTDPRWWTRTMGENLPNMVAMMTPAGLAGMEAAALGAVPKVAKGFALAGGFMGSAVIEAGSAYNSAKQEMEAEGKLDPDEIERIARNEGVAVGLANATLEMGPLGLLLMKIPGANKILKRFISQALAEGTTEPLQEGVAMLVEKAGHNPELAFTSARSTARLIESFAGGLGMGLFVGGGRVAVDKTAQIKQTLQDKKKLKDEVRARLEKKNTPPEDIQLVEDETTDFEKQLFIMEDNIEVAKEEALKEVDPLIEEAGKYKSAEEFVASRKSEYVGVHEAPTKLDGESSAPLNNITGIYPEDIYSPEGARYYGDGSPFDLESISIISGAKGKPNKKVKIYRAVPDTKTNQEMITVYEGQLKSILKNGKIPDQELADRFNLKNSSEYYDFISNEIDRLKTEPEVSIAKPTINTGDWVTINRKYAKEHGESSLGGNYKIISKTVFADEIFTEGNSIHEFGYDPRVGGTKTKEQLTKIWEQAQEKQKKEFDKLKSELPAIAEKIERGQDLTEQDIDKINEVYNKVVVGDPEAGVSQEAIDKVKTLADNLGVQMADIEMVDEEMFIDPEKDMDQQTLQEHGINIEEVKKDGRKYQIFGEIVTSERDGQKRSSIKIFKGATNKDLYHEFAHAVEEQGGLPGWRGTKEEHAKYLEDLLSEGREGELVEFTPEGTKVGREMGDFSYYSKSQKSIRGEEIDRILKEKFRGIDDDTIVAEEKIDITLLERAKGGTSRNVYILNDEKVIKVAKTAKGLEQNAPASDYFIGENEHFPNTYEIGMDYVVTENIKRNDKVTRQYLKPLQKFSAIDFENKTSELQDAMNEMGLDDFLNYDLLWNDFIAGRNWGVREDGTPVLVDEGALLAGVHSRSEVDPVIQRDWAEVLAKRRLAKKQRGTLRSIREGELVEFTQEGSKVGREITEGQQRSIREDFFYRGTLFKKGSKPNTMVGFRVMELDPETNNIISEADSRIVKKLQKGEFSYGERGGFFVGNRPSYVYDFYGNNELSAILEIEFKESDVEDKYKKNLIDRDPEISVKSGEIVDFEIFNSEQYPKMADDFGLTMEELDSAWEEYQAEQITLRSIREKVGLTKQKIARLEKEGIILKPGTDRLGKLIQNLQQIDSLEEAQKRIAEVINIMRSPHIKEIPENKKYKLMDQIRTASSPEALKSILSQVVLERQTGRKVLEVGQTIKDKGFKKIDNLRKAMKLPTLQKMTLVQLKKYEKAFEEFDEGDTFLTQRQIETVDNTELKGIRTLREARERLAEEMNVPVEDLMNIKVSGLDKLRYDTALAAKHPVYKMLVEEYHKEMLQAEAEFIEIEETINDLTRKARKSRKRGVVDRLIPTDKAVFKYMSVNEVEKGAMVENGEITKEERDLAEYLVNQFALALEYLIKTKSLDGGRKNYITNIRRDFLEAYKEDGMVQAFKEVLNQQKLDEQMFDILDQITGEILPLNKFFQFSMKRTGTMKPSQNVAKASITYFRTLARKKALDRIIPKMMIYVDSLTPPTLTKGGLETDQKLRTFVKKWINTKKGRPDNWILRPGRWEDILVKSAKSFVTVMDLGLNIPVGVASSVGETVANFVNLGNRATAKGIIRKNTPQGKKILAKHKAFVGRSYWSELTDASKGLQDKTMMTLFGLFKQSSVRANKTFLLGSLTEEEFRTGDISPERLAEIQNAMGRYRVVEGSKSIIGSTTEGGLATQYKTWAVPILSSMSSNIVKLVKSIGSKQARGKLTGKEVRELGRAVEITLAALIVLSLVPDEDEDTFIGKFKGKVKRESLTILGALDPSFWTSMPRLLQWANNLSEALVDVVMVEKYKSGKKKGESKGVSKLKTIATPRAIKQFQE
jgi:hypothetical protein